MGDIVRYGSDTDELILFDDSLEAGFDPIIAKLCLKDFIVLTVFPKQKRKKRIIGVSTCIIQIIFLISNWT